VPEEFVVAQRRAEPTYFKPEAIEKIIEVGEVAHTLQVS
jgi:hypothetical protein